MKNLFIAFFIVLASSYNSFAKWGYVSLDELVKDSDLIIIGTLQEVSEYTKNDVDYGEGFILVEEIVFESPENSKGFTLKPKDKLQLKWQNNSFIACPRISHKHSKNKKEIWLLTIEFDGTVWANYPGRSRSLEDLKEIEKLLGRLKKNKAPEMVITQKQINHTEQSVKINESFANIEGADASDTKQYSVFNALVVAFLSLTFYWILYRSKFKIR